MTGSSIRRLLFAMTCVVAALLCAPQTAPGKAMLESPKTASRDFSGTFGVFVSVESVQVVGRHQVEWHAATRTASDIPLWLSRDPFGEAGGLNLYGYVRNDPINNVDDRGLSVIATTHGAYVFPREEGPIAAELFRLTTAALDYNRRSERAITALNQVDPGPLRGSVELMARRLGIDAGAPHVQWLIDVNSEERRLWKSTALAFGLSENREHQVKLSSWGYRGSRIWEIFREGAELFPEGLAFAATLFSGASITTGSSFEFEWSRAFYRIDLPETEVRNERTLFFAMGPFGIAGNAGRRSLLTGRRAFSMLDEVPAGGDELITFYRGTTKLVAIEAVQNQAFDVSRILRNQEDLGRPLSRRGIFLTRQKTTAQYYADEAATQGRGLGPAVVEIQIPRSQFDDLVSRYGIDVEVPVPRPPRPGQTETLIPTGATDEFNNLIRLLYGE